eukprot:11149947-Prorocentrum_lima.AAC.1
MRSHVDEKPDKKRAQGLSLAAQLKGVFRTDCCPSDNCAPITTAVHHVWLKGLNACTALCMQ